MFGSPQKRPRTLRTSVRPETFWSRMLLRLRDRDRLLRLGLCLLASLVLLVLLKSWRAPFPHRAGQFSADGIAARIDFQRIDEEATAEMRQRAEEEVPPIFRHHPERLEGLSQKLRAALGELAQAESLDELTPQTAQDFGLRPPEGVPPEEAPVRARFLASDPQTRFERLKAALGSMEMGTAQGNIDAIVDDFSKFIAPLRKYGRIHPAAVARHSLNPGDRVRILAPGDEPTGTDVLLAQVRLSDQLNDAGELGGSWLSYPSLTAEIRPAISHWLLVNTPGTLEFDKTAYDEARKAARDSVPVQVEEFDRGDVLVPPGETVTDEQLELLWTEYWVIESEVTFRERLLRVGTVLALILVLALLNGYYIVRNEPRLARSISRLSVYLFVVVVAASLGRSLTFFAWPVEVIPLLATAMVLAVAYNPVLAILTAFTTCVIVTLSSTSELAQFTILISTTATGIVPMHRVASRKKIVIVGFYAAACYLFVSLGIGLLQSQSIREMLVESELVWQSLRGAALCIVTGYLVAGSLPFIESGFGVVTDISLLELSDPSHPLLQELVRRAPGTYNHSISVGSIAETAAEAIGANGLLVRVGAYFHDIGKMLKPQYFIENMQEGAENRHQHLAPAMSTLIIIGHVKDGADLAEQHNLPPALIDFIEQHHGTTLVEYFYHAAAKRAEEQPDHKTDAEESSFRYPGPKPQTREAGVLMLADAVESASRTLSDPTPKRIESLVHSLTMKRLLDGQFDESPLKLSEIRTIEESLSKSLIAVYHGRIRYPEARTA